MREYAIGEPAAMDRCFGVYSKMEEVPTFNINVSDSEEYCKYYNNMVIPRIRKRVERIGLGAADSYFYTVIPAIQNIIACKKKCNIVDIGGGQGENYIRLEKFFGRECLEYHVVEQEKNCIYGRKLELPGNIYFHENNGVDSGCLNKEAIDLLASADICLLIGVLQYFSPYSNLLREIAGAGVEYVFITRTMINNVTDTFFSRYYIAPDSGEKKDIIIGDGAMAVINHQELNRIMYDLGYDICLDLFQLDNFKEMGSLPEPYNKVEYRNMLFQTRKARIL